MSVALPFPDKQNLTFAFAGIFTLEDLEVESDSSILTLNSNVTLKVTITSHLLAEVKMRKISVPCEKLEEVNCTRQPTDFHAISRNILETLR